MSDKESWLTVQLGLRIRQLREARGLKQKELAHAAHSDPTTLSKLERGNSSPSLRYLIELAEVLGVEPGAILSAALDPRELALLDAARANDSHRALAALASLGVQLDGPRVSNPTLTPGEIRAVGRGVAAFLHHLAHAIAGEDNPDELVASWLKESEP